MQSARSSAPKKGERIRCVQLRKHSKAREKRYSFGYAVSFIVRAKRAPPFRCRIADLLPKRRNAQNRFPLYGFGAILGVFFRYERLHIGGGILTVRHSKAAVCRFRVTKKRRITTTLLFCSEDGARERYSIICCTFSSCLQPLCQWLHRR